MFLRKLRWIAAGVVALAAVAPARADVTIMVNQVDSGGNVVNNLGQYNGGTLNTGVFNITSVGTSVGGNGTFGGLSTSFNLTISDNFSQAAGNGLQLVVTSTNYANNFANQPGTFTNQASATSGIYGTDNGTQLNIAGIAQVTSTTTVAGSSSPPSTAASQGSPAVGPITNGNVANLPGAYSIIQTITIYALPVTNTALISTGAPFQGGASSTVTANAAGVPAPPALALALVALPVLGLRRKFARKAA